MGVRPGLTAARTYSPPTTRGILLVEPLAIPVVGLDLGRRVVAQ
jgi:hypothetical protein